MELGSERGNMLYCLATLFCVMYCSDGDGMRRFFWGKGEIGLCMYIFTPFTLGLSLS